MSGLNGPNAMLSMQSKINANTKAIAAGGGGGGSTIIVKQEDTTLTGITTLDFLSGATVSEDPSGTATIAISAAAPRQGFSPINVASCAVTEMFEAAGNTILYLTIAEETMAIDRCTIWGIASSANNGQVEVKYYRYGTGWGSAGSVPFLGATSAATLGDGPNDISLLTEDGQTNTVTAGETIIVGIRHVAGTFNAVSDTGFNSKLYGQRPSNGEVPMAFPVETPAVESEDWIETNSRPAMTLWKA